MSEDKMIGAIDAKYRKKIEKKKREWGHKEYRVNPDGSVQGYEEYLWDYHTGVSHSSPYPMKGVVRWWRK